MSSAGDVNPGGRGYRRARLAAMAGNLYRSGQQAVSGMRDQYAQTRVGLDAGNDGHGRTHIPGAFPDVAIHVQGNDQMVIFPSYAKRHVKKDWAQIERQQQQQQQQQQQNAQGNAQGTVKDGEYWRQEWEKNEDEKAIVDVDVRGWVYSPQLGPMTRRNRMLIGLARQLSGITAPRNEAQQPQDSPGGALRAQHQMNEERREQERIQREAANIERRGQEEKRAAYHGDYSERPQRNESENGSTYPYRAQQGSESDSGPSSPIRAATQYSTTSTPTSAATEMSEAELAVANANLMARIAPFMTNPLVALPITVFFYNESQSQSRTVITNDAGHFVLRAALDFVPTHVRVLANEKLSAIQEVYITEPHGVSLISDVDDTIKKSNISGGAKEIFRNTFVHSLGDLTIDGVKEWYNDMHQLGVSIHYCSNSPWQLYPVLASYFKLVGLPPGSLHLKQYTGMLQGIFEPVAERKKSTLERLLRDFPERKFLLVGDSGEADLEVYTELAIANPGRILAIFIRDVTTPEKTGFFETSFGGVRRQASSLTLNESNKPQAPRPLRQRPSAPALRDEKKSTGPVTGDLIDFSEEPQQVKLQEPAASNQAKSSKKPPPPRPAKPASLRSTPSIVEPNGTPPEPSPQDEKPPPLPARRTATHPLAQMQSSSQQTSGSSRNGPPRNGAGPQDISRKPLADRTVPPPPPPQRRGTPASMRSSANSDVEYDPQPPPSASAGSLLSAGTTRSAGRSPGVTPPASPQLGPQQTTQALNRKLDLWNRRLERAHEELDALGVALYTWRRGQDVIEEAVGIVTRAHREMERRGQTARDR